MYVPEESSIENIVSKSEEAEKENLYLDYKNKSNAELNLSDNDEVYDNEDIIDDIELNPTDFIFEAKNIIDKINSVDDNVSLSDSETETFKNNKKMKYTSNIGHEDSLEIANKNFSESNFESTDKSSIRIQHDSLKFEDTRQVSLSSVLKEKSDNQNFVNNNVLDVITNKYNNANDNNSSRKEMRITRHNSEGNFDRIMNLQNKKKPKKFGKSTNVVFRLDNKKNEKQFRAVKSGLMNAISKQKQQQKKQKPSKLHKFDSEKCIANSENIESIEFGRDELNNQTIKKFKSNSYVDKYGSYEGFKSDNENSESEDDSKNFTSENSFFLKNHTCSDTLDNSSEQTEDLVMIESLESMFLRREEKYIKESFDDLNTSPSFTYAYELYRAKVFVPTFILSPYCDGNTINVQIDYEENLYESVEYIQSNDEFFYNKLRNQETPEAPGLEDEATQDETQLIAHILNSTDNDHSIQITIMTEIEKTNSSEDIVENQLNKSSNFESLPESHNENQMECIYEEHNDHLNSEARKKVSDNDDLIEDSSLNYYESVSEDTDDDDSVEENSKNVKDVLNSIIDLVELNQEESDNCIEETLLNDNLNIELNNEVQNQILPISITESKESELNELESHETDELLQITEVLESLCENAISICKMSEVSSERTDVENVSESEDDVNLMDTSENASEKQENEPVDQVSHVDSITYESSNIDSAYEVEKEVQVEKIIDKSDTFFFVVDTSNNQVLQANNQIQFDQKKKEDSFFNEIADRKKPHCLEGTNDKPVLNLSIRSSKSQKLVSGHEKARSEIFSDKKSTESLVDKTAENAAGELNINNSSTLKTDIDSLSSLSSAIKDIFKNSTKSKKVEIKLNILDSNSQKNTSDSEKASSENINEKCSDDGDLMMKLKSENADDIETDEHIVITFDLNFSNFPGFHVEKSSQHQNGKNTCLSLFCEYSPPDLIKPKQNLNLPTEDLSEHKTSNKTEDFNVKVEEPCEIIVTDESCHDESILDNEESNVNMQTIVVSENKLDTLTNDITEEKENETEVKDEVEDEKIVENTNDLELDIDSHDMDEHDTDEHETDQLDIDEEHDLQIENEYENENVGSSESVNNNIENENENDTLINSLAEPVLNDEPMDSLNEESIANVETFQNQYAKETNESEKRKPRPSYLIEKNNHIFGGVVDEEEEDEFFISSGAVYQSWPYIYEPGFKLIPIIENDEIIHVLSKSDNVVYSNFNDDDDDKSNINEASDEDVELNDYDLANYSLKNYGLNLIHVDEKKLEKKKKRKRMRSKSIDNLKKADGFLSSTSTSAESESEDMESSYESSDDSASILAYEERHARGFSRNLNTFTLNGTVTKVCSHLDLLYENPNTDLMASGDQYSGYNQKNNSNETTRKQNLLPRLGRLTNSCADNSFANKRALFFSEKNLGVHNNRCTLSAKQIEV